MARSKVQMNGKELKRLQKQLQAITNSAREREFFESCAKELAARLLAKVIKRTPVGQYPPGSGKVGGTLQKGWTASKDIRVQKVGSDYVVEIVNPVVYASYVEFGHRTANHSGWVEGQFMLTISEKEIQNAAPFILERKLENWLKECFR